MKLTIKKTANIVSLIEKGNASHIIKTWYAEEFTDRKLKNIISKLQKSAPQGTAIIFE